MIISPKKAIAEGWIISDHEDGILPEHIQPNGIDLVCRQIFYPGFNIDKIVSNISTKEFADSSLLSPLQIFEDSKYYYTVEPFAYYLVDCHEKVTIPKGVAAKIIKRSRVNRAGVILQSALWDSGFRGRLGLTLFPFGRIIFEKCEPLAQIVFFDAEDSGVLYDGNFQNQESHV